MSRKRLLLVTNKAQGGGAEKIIRKYCTYLSDIFDVTLISLTGVVDKSEEVIKYRHVALSRHRLSSGFVGLYNFVKKYDYDVILCFSFETLIVLAMVQHKARYKLIIRNINNPKMYLNDILQKRGFLFYFIYRFLLKRAIIKCDIVIHQCIEMLQNWNLDLLTQKRNIVIFNTAECPKRDNYNRSNNDTFIFVGRLENQKQPIELIKAFNKFGEDETQYKLDIYGDGSLMAECQELASANGNLCLKGWETNQIMYHNYRALILTSLYEGFPNVALEALMQGVPVISFDCPYGPKEIIIDGKNGFLVSDNSFQKLLEKLNLLQTLEWNTEQIIDDANARFGIRVFEKNMNKLVNYIQEL